MDYSNLALILGILVYGAVEYHRREQRHRASLALLREGGVPPVVETIPPLYKLWTTGVVCAFLLVAAIGFTIARPGILYGGDTLYILAAVFLILFALLFRMLIRDIHLRRARLIR